MTTPIAQGPVDVNVRGWIKVEDSLPKPFSRDIRKHQGVLAYVKDPANIYGGMPMILFYGAFAWMATEDNHEGEDEDGMIAKFGWYYERDSEGEYDSLIFDMNGKVTHWMPLPDAPNG